MSATADTLSGVLVDGEWRPAGAVIEDRNPARPDEVVAAVGAATAADVRDAYAAARAALPGWRRTPAIKRGEILFRAAELVAARADAIGTELAREEGKTLPEARGETLRAAAILRWFAGEASQPIGDVHPSAGEETFLYSMREPLGVVGVITPWNFPIAIPTWKVAPALAFGNTVVLKPSEVTPLCALRLAEALQEAGLPDGVLNVVCGLPGEIGDAMTGDVDLDGLTFTGSHAVGKMIQGPLVERGVKVQLELGGKNPVVVLDDADLGLAVEQTVRGAMFSTGQRCTATSRAIVTPGIAARFTDALVERVRGLRVGDPLDPQTAVGPLVSEAQRDRVVSYLGVAAEEGHALAAGGGTRDGGWFVEPTVYLDVPPDSRLGREEIFGPVLGVMPVADLDEAIAIANDVDFGLSASVFTRDLRAAMTFVREIEAGVVHVNSESTGAEPQVPFGGMKSSSSHSREQGKAAAEFFTAVKTVYLDLPPEAAR